MAQRVTITDTPNCFEIVVDGQGITDVLSYRLESSPSRKTLTVVTEIMESVTARIEAPK